MSEPKFKIGEFVYWRQDLRVWRENAWPIIQKSNARDYVSELGMPRKPMALQVVGILIERCYGGEQIHYVVRKSGNGETLKLTEIEVTNETPEPVAAPGSETP